MIVAVVISAIAQFWDISYSKQDTKTFSGPFLGVG